jgi:hypothetical protein
MIGQCPAYVLAPRVAGFGIVLAHEERDVGRS